MRIKFSRFFQLPFFPVILAPFLLFFIPLIGGQVLFWGLPATQFIPWRAYALEQMTQGLLPLWNPLNGMGAPLLANYQLALFYPPGWLVFLAGVAWGTPGMAWVQTLLIPVHLAWAGLGMVMLGRRLGFGTLGQAVVGLAFGLSGYWVARAGFFSMIWAGSWLPWIMLGASAIAAPIREEKMNGTRGLIKMWLIMPVAMQLLAGHAQLSWYTLVLAGLWIGSGGWVAGHWKGAGRALGIYALNGLLAVGVAAIQLLPTAEYLLQSQRAGSVDYELGLTYSFWPWRLLTLLAPGFFGTPAAGNYWGYASFWEDAAYLGFLPLVIGLGMLPWAGRRGNDKPLQPLVRLAIGIIFAGFLFALGNNTPLFPFLYGHVPTFNLFNGPARWMIWVVFGLCLLAGIGAGEWKRPTGKALRRFKRLVAAALAVTLGAAVTWLILRDVQITFIEATALLGVWATGACLLTLAQPRDFSSPAYVRWSWGVVVWIALDLLCAGWNSQPALPADYFAKGQTALTGAHNGRVYLSAADEYALKFRRFFRFSDYQAIEDWIHLRQIALPDMNLLAEPHFSFVNNFDPFVPGRFARWLQELEDAPLVERKEMLRLMGVSDLMQRDDTQAMGVSITPVEGLSRFRWLACATWVNGEEAAWQALKLEMADDRRQTGQILVLEGDGSAQPACQHATNGSLTILEERPDRIQIAMDALTDGYLLIADTWYPGWQAVVDGQPQTIYRANTLFRGLRVTAGKHQVELAYRPQSFTIGAWISGVVFLFMVLWSRFIKDRVQSSSN